MKKETIENILKFLEDKENKELPKKWVDLVERLKETLKLIKELENHPDGVQYKHKGTLYLKDSNIKKLPNDLYVDGSLSLYGCEQLTKLPDKLIVVGYLDLDKSDIIELPNKLFVGFDLCIFDTPLAEKYTDEEIREIVASTGGKIRGSIIRQ